MGTRYLVIGLQSIYELVLTSKGLMTTEKLTKSQILL